MADKPASGMAMHCEMPVIVYLAGSYEEEGMLGYVGDHYPEGSRARVRWTRTGPAPTW